MKRLIFTIALALALCAPANAQLDIQKIGDKAEQVATLTAFWNWLYRIDDFWYLVTKTDNQFDDNIWIMIGDTDEAALTSVYQLEQLLEEMGEKEMFEVKGRDSKSVTLSVYKQMGARQGFQVYKKGAAGTGYIYKGGFKKAKAALEQEILKRTMK